MLINSCSTGKNCYATLEEVQEALIHQRSLYDEKSNQGPLSYYFCETCGMYHLTSKGGVANFLSKPEIQLRIRQLREKNYWERKTKRK
jgi:hypothetical protein